MLFTTRSWAACAFGVVILRWRNTFEVLRSFRLTRVLMFEAALESVWAGCSFMLPNADMVTLAEASEW